MHVLIGLNREERITDIHFRAGQELRAMMDRDTDGSDPFYRNRHQVADIRLRFPYQEWRLIRYLLGVMVGEIEPLRGGQIMREKITKNGRKFSDDDIVKALDRLVWVLSVTA